MQIPRFRCKMTLHLIPEPEEKGSELLRDLAANDNGANRWHLHIGFETIEQIPNGSGGAFLEAALTPTRADDKERKGYSP